MPDLPERYFFACAARFMRVFVPILCGYLTKLPPVFYHLPDVDMHPRSCVVNAARGSRTVTLCHRYRVRPTRDWFSRAPFAAFHAYLPLQRQPA